MSVQKKPVGSTSPEQKQQAVSAYTQAEARKAVAELRQDAKKVRTQVDRVLASKKVRWLPVCKKANERCNRLSKSKSKIAYPGGFTQWCVDAGLNPKTVQNWLHNYVAKSRKRAKSTPNVRRPRSAKPAAVKVASISNGNGRATVNRFISLSYLPKGSWAEGISEKDEILVGKKTSECLNLCGSTEAFVSMMNNNILFLKQQAKVAS